MRSVLLCLTITVFPATALRAAAPPEPEYKLVLQTPPAVAVDSVTVSPDGSVVATASGEGGVRLYNAKSGNLLRVLGEIGDRGVVFSPDGKMLTAAGFHMDKLVALWDVRTGKRLRTFEGQTEWEADATAISPDGKLLASTATDKQILVWDIATGQLRLRLKNQPYRVSALAFSPDSATLAGGGGEKAIRLWDCTTGRLVKSFEGQSDWICTLSFSADGKRIASGSCDWGFHRGHDWPRSPLRGIERCEWRVWDVGSGKLLRQVSDRGRLLSLAIAPDGGSLACGIGKEVRVYDLSSDAAPRVLTTHDADVTSVAFTPDGAALVSGSHDHTVKYTQLAGGQVRWRSPGYFEQVNSVALSNDGSLLVTGSSDGRFARGWLAAGAKQMGPGAVRIWDARTGHLLRRLGDPGEQVMAVAISPDGRTVAAGSGIEGGKGSTHIWDTASGKALWSSNDSEGEVLAAAFAPDDASLATGTADGVVKICACETGRVSRTFSGHNGGATAIAFSPNGNALYCGQGYGGARVWDVHSGKLIRTCYVEDSQTTSFTIDRRLTSIGLTKDGATLATCASSVNDEFVDRIRLWDAGAGTLQRDFDFHGRPVTLSPDGSILATGGKSIMLWDARSGKPIRQLYGFLKRTQSISFSADGKLIVSGGSYGTTNIWEVATGRHLITLFTFSNPRDGSISDDWLAYTPEGYYDGSPDVARFLAWRVGDELQTPLTLGAQFHHPDRVAAALASVR